MKRLLQWAKDSRNRDEAVKKAMSPTLRQEVCAGLRHPEYPYNLIIKAKVPRNSADK